MSAKVVVAMSGGVDSSVTAALLVEQGYEVIGVTMQIWDPGVEEVAGEYVGCCSLAAVEDARRVAFQLGIPYYVLNLRREFEREVVANFVDEYLRGRTPNPCIVCNRKIKFSALLEKVRALGADYLATGHYARIERDKAEGRFLLFRGRDRRKDQSYFLYNLTQEQLAAVLFPLGNFTKEEVRDLARRWQLPVAEKEESQEICFVNDNDYGRFIAEKAPAGAIKPGPFLDLEGRMIGSHRGLPYYTIGQRRGLGLATGRRMYVVDIDPVRNAVIVGPEEALMARELIASRVNFIPFERLADPLPVEAKIRYNAAAAQAVIYPLQQEQVKVVFAQPQRAITPGQSVVFYQGEMVVGGGIIESCKKGEP